MYQNLSISSNNTQAAPYFTHPPSPVSTFAYKNRFPQHQQQLVAARKPLANLSQYINPTSNQARQAIIAHEKGKKQRSDDCYKTVMCQNWLERAACGFGKNCRFAHGEHELRPGKLPLEINRNYKTRLCEKYTSKGICPYGDRCLFIHPDQPSMYGPPSNVFQHSNFRMGFAAESPPELRDFSNSLPLPIFQKSRNLLPQVQEQLRMERRENKRKQLHELLKKQDRILASVEDGPSSSLTTTITAMGTPNSTSSSNGHQQQKSYDPFETLISTLSNVLDTSDLP